MDRVTRRYQRGDPDPTPDMLLGSVKCPARVLMRNENGREYWLECTWRDDEHDPYQHVAAGVGVILHVWDV